MTDETPQVQQRESIKVMKMSKGYQWEIKILNMQMSDLAVTKTGVEKNIPLEAVDIARLEKLNDEMKLKFGSEPI